MKILIIDDMALWIEQGKKLLERAGHEVSGFEVTDPQSVTAKELPDDLNALIHGVELVLVDKDLGQGITSTRLICVIRDKFPMLPIIRWTGGYERISHMPLLKVSTIDKPTRKIQPIFIDKFAEALTEQMALHFGPMGLFDSLKEVVTPKRYQSDKKKKRLKQLAEIAQLADKDQVDSGDWQYPWMITGRSGGVTKHELGHCICDGDLTVEDIRPHLPALQKVIKKFEDAGEIDDRFNICANFLKEGDLSKLELVHRCY